MEATQSDINKELVGLESDRRASEVAIKGQQTMMSEMLNGAMGKGMLSVLKGEVQVKPIKKPFWDRFFEKLDNILFFLNG